MWWNKMYKYIICYLLKFCSFFSFNIIYLLSGIYINYSNSFNIIYLGGIYNNYCNILLVVMNRYYIYK